MRIARVVPAPTLACLVLVWAGAVGVGLKTIWDYSTTPGARRPHPLQWPAGTAIARSTDHSTLVMFMHPRCACSTASLSALRDLLRTPGVTLSAQVVFLEPDGTEAGWSRTGTWDAAQRISGVAVLTDVQGREAAP